MEGGGPLGSYGSGIARPLSSYVIQPVLGYTYQDLVRFYVFTASTKAQRRQNRMVPRGSRAVVVHYVIDGPNHCFPFSESEIPIVFSPILRARGYNGGTSHLLSPPSPARVLCAIQSYRLVPSSPLSSF